MTWEFTRKIFSRNLIGTFKLEFYYAISNFDPIKSNLKGEFDIEKMGL